MTAPRQFTVPVHEVPRQIVVEHDALRDRVQVTVDGAAVPTRLSRKPFSPLWRFQFEVEGTPLEVRVQVAGLRGEVDIDVCSTTAAPPGATLSVGAIATVSACAFFLGPAVGFALGLQAPLVPSLAIGAFAALGTTAILWLVYGRAPS